MWQKYPLALIKGEGGYSFALCEREMMELHFQSWRVAKVVCSFISKMKTMSNGFFYFIFCDKIDDIHKEKLCKVINGGHYYKVLLCLCLKALICGPKVEVWIGNFWLLKIFRMKENFESYPSCAHICIHI